MSEEKPKEIMGVSLGGWIQWGLPVIAGFAAWYVSSVIAPLDTTVRKLDDAVSMLQTNYETMSIRALEYNRRIEKLESTLDAHHQQAISTYQTKEQARRDYDNLSRAIENVARSSR